MRRFASLFLLLAIFPAQSASTAQLDWLWKRDTPTCTLQQAYSATDGIVSLSRSPGDDESGIWIGSRQEVWKPSERFDHGKIRLLPAGEFDADLSVARDGERQEVWAWTKDQSFLDKFARATAVELTHDKVRATRVPVRSTAAAVQAIRACEDSRMRQWGIDPVAWRALKARPRRAEGSTEWVGPEDYPAGALLELQQGFMILKMTVGPDGRVQDCQSLTRKRSPNNPNRICPKLKRKARFEPAISATGQPVAAPFVMIIRFRIEGMERPFGAQDPLRKDGPTS